MDLMIQLVGIVAGVTGVWMTWWTYLSNKRLEVFHIYVDKFRQIITAEDVGWWSAMMRGEQPKDEERPRCEVKMVLYLNLVWEEYYLYTERLISKRLWQLWEPNIVMVLNTAFCRDVFDRHRQEFSPDFCSWVDQVAPPHVSPQSEAEAPPPTRKASLSRKQTEEET